MAQIKPSNSRPTAVTTTPLFLPLASVRTFLSPYSFLYLIGVISIRNVSEAHLTSRMIRVLAPFLDVSW
jgi:hypothetical protein